MMKMAHCHSILHPWSTISFSYMICTYPDMHTVTFEPIKVNLFKAMPSVRGWRIWIGRRGEGRSAATAVTWAGTEWTAPTTSWKPTFLVNTMVNETIHDHSWPFMTIHDHGGILPGFPSNWALMGKTWSNLGYPSGVGCRPNIDDGAHHHRCQRSHCTSIPDHHLGPKSGRSVWVSGG